MKLVVWVPRDRWALGAACALAWGCGSRSDLNLGRPESSAGGGAPNGGTSSGGASNGGTSNGGAGGLPNATGGTATGGAAGCPTKSVLPIDSQGFPSSVVELPCSTETSWQAALSGDGERAVLFRNSVENGLEGWGFLDSAWKRIDVDLDWRVVSWSSLWLADNTDRAWFAYKWDAPSGTDALAWIEYSSFREIARAGGSVSSTISTSLRTDPIDTTSPLRFAQLSPAATTGTVMTAEGDILVWLGNHWDIAAWPYGLKDDLFAIDTTDTRVGALRNAENGDLDLGIFSSGSWGHHTVSSGDGTSDDAPSNLVPLAMKLAREGSTAYAVWQGVLDGQPLITLARQNNNGTWELSSVSNVKLASAGPALAIDARGDTGFAAFVECGKDCSQPARVAVATLTADDLRVTPIWNGPDCIGVGHMSVGKNGTRAFSMLCDAAAYFVHSKGLEESWHVMPLPRDSYDSVVGLPSVSVDTSGEKALISWNVTRVGEVRQRTQVTVFQF